jgi:filamentous hemagglutinin
MASLEGAAGGITTVYRVEGAINQRVLIDAAGKVSVQGRNMLFLNFGDAARAEQFLATRVAQGMKGATMKSFQVPTSFVDELAASAVPESMARQFPNAPLVVDVTKAANQFGLRPAQIEALKRAIIQGSGR